MFIFPYEYKVKQHNNYKLVTVVTRYLTQPLCMQINPWTASAGVAVEPRACFVCMHCPKPTSHKSTEAVLSQNSH